MHNAGTCTIDIHTRSFNTITDPEQRGFRGEFDVLTQLKAADYEPVGKSFDVDPSKSPTEAYALWDGQTGIDGIYAKEGKYVIVESKATGGTKKADPVNCVGKLCNTDDGRQMSNDWIEARLDKIVTDPVEHAKIREDFQSNKVTKDYAQTDGVGASYHVINDNGSNDVLIGDPWIP